MDDATPLSFPARDTLRRCLFDAVRAAGAVVRSHFRRVGPETEKESASSVVTEADLASERCLVDTVRAAFPEHGIIAEESGVQPGPEPITWVMDPLDGTSNFVAGLPWFGVQVAVFEQGQPVLAAMYLPVDDTLYWAERGGGAFRGEHRLRLTRETSLRRVLCAFGFDGAGDAEATRRSAVLLAHVAAGVRNIRATNSLVDFTLTLEGHFGACVNLNPRVWDIAPASLMFAEAGGQFTGIDGRPIEWDLGRQAAERVYPIAAANEALHRELIRRLVEARATAVGRPEGRGTRTSKGR